MAEKKKVENKKTSKRYKLYEKAGNELKRKSKFCPRCGSGVFLANHKDRYTCGACNYMEKK
jgi:small subunit ribosomal protein S27Ae